MRETEVAEMQRVKLLIIALLFSLTGCASVGTKVDTYSGEYFYNFEYAYLTPDGSNEQWCLKGDMSRAELPSKGAEGTSHVTVQGALGPRGSYGNLGVCKRILTVTKLVKVTDMRGK
jgi:uncharacterized protein YceK